MATVGKTLQGDTVSARVYLAPSEIISLHLWFEMSASRQRYCCILPVDTNFQRFVVRQADS
jgi:hypothetical protein